MILPHNNRELAREYFEQLPSGDINHKYFEGEKYQTPRTLLGSLVNSFSLKEKLTTLQKFYPYQKIVSQTVNEIASDNVEYFKNSLIFTGVAWTFIFNAARRGAVAPLFREYGAFLNTHRLYRHYVYTLVGPLLYSAVSLKTKYYSHIEQLWIVHANRLNAQNLVDPLYTYYPKESLAPRRKVFVNTTFQDFGPGKQYEEQVEDEDEEEDAAEEEE